MTETPPGDPQGFEPMDPYALARRERAATQLRRFYATATVAGRRDGFVPLLDGRPVKTPARHEVTLPSRAAARGVADEWTRQGDVILPETMPFTRLVNTAIDGVSRRMADVLGEIAQFAATDLLCYRAATPPELVDAQASAWDPVLAWSRDELGARLYLAEGVMYVAQPEPALAAIERALEVCVGQGEAAPFRLASLHLMTTLTGSVLLALATASGALSAEDAWHKAHVDEDFQISLWGEDFEASERRLRRWSDMRAAASMIEALA